MIHGVEALMPSFPELPVQFPVVLVEVDLDNPAVPHSVDGDFLAFKGLATALGRPVDEGDGVLSASDDLTGMKAERASGTLTRVPDHGEDGVGTA